MSPRREVPTVYWQAIVAHTLVVPSTRKECRICVTVRLPVRPRGETMYWQANVNTPLPLPPLLNVPYIGTGNCNDALQPDMIPRSTPTTIFCVTETEILSVATPAEPRGEKTKKRKKQLFFWEKLNRGVSKPGCFPLFSGKVQIVSRTLSGTVPRRCS